LPVPRIAITLGEPAGIGPDIAALIAGNNYPAELVAIGDAGVLSDRAKQLQVPLELESFTPGNDPSSHTPGRLKILHVPCNAPCKPGVLDTDNAKHVLNILQHAVSGCQTDLFQAIATAPVQKSVINDAGIPFSGHTEFLAEATDTKRVVMMLACPNLRVALATTHLPLREVASAIDQPLLREVLQILHTDLQTKFRISAPKIAVLGLNPHAGEGGHMGDEEIRVITPVLDDLRAAGMDLLGPLPADTAFNPENLQHCDAFLAMFHDQGLPVLKYAGFGEAINITLGLPIIRTSVDHGTALQLAGSGLADPSSMHQAINTAISMCLAQNN
jgi:4-hydroxythreonine-4-phosphate dehydrogenase